MNKEVFTDLIKTAQSFNKELDKWYDFGIELDDKPIAELGWKFFNLSIQEAFDTEGVDWINWWLFDKIDVWNKAHEAYNPDGSIIPTDTIDDLWELVKEYQK